MGAPKHGAWAQSPRIPHAVQRMVRRIRRPCGDWTPLVLSRGGPSDRRAYGATHRRLGRGSGACQPATIYPMEPRPSRPLFISKNRGRRAEYRCIFTRLDEFRTNDRIVHHGFTSSRRTRIAVVPYTDFDATTPTTRDLSSGADYPTAGTAPGISSMTSATSANERAGRSPGDSRSPATSASSAPLRRNRLDRRGTGDAERGSRRSDDGALSAPSLRRDPRPQRLDPEPAVTPRGARGRACPSISRKPKPKSARW